MITRRRWTEEERAQLREGVALGFDGPTLARWLGRTERSVRHRFAVESIQLDKPWTKPEERALMAARAEGEPYKSIARRLGRTIYACRMRALKLRRGAA